jgi:hypothetical protein
MVDNATCNQSSHYGGSILSGMFCAGELDLGGKDACQGKINLFLTYITQHDSCCIIYTAKFMPFEIDCEIDPKFFFLVYLGFESQLCSTRTY